MPIRVTPRSDVSEDSINSISLTAPLYSGECILIKSVQSQYAIPTVHKKILKEEADAKVHRPKTPKRHVNYKRSGLLSDKNKNVFQRNHRSYLNQFRTAYKLPGCDLKSIVRSESVETIYGGSTQSSHTSLNEYLENQAAQIYSKSYILQNEAPKYIMQPNQQLQDKHEEEVIYNEIRKQSSTANYSTDHLAANSATLSDVIKEERMNIPYLMNGTLSLTGHKNEYKNHESDHKKTMFKRRNTNSRSKKQLSHQEKRCKTLIRAQNTECGIANNDQISDNISMVDKEKETHKAPLTTIHSTDHDTNKNKLNLSRKRSEYGKRIEYRNQTKIKYSKKLNQIEGVDETKICFDRNNKNKNKKNNNNNIQKHEKNVEKIFKSLPESSQLNTLKKINLNKCQQENVVDEGIALKTMTGSLEKVDLNNNHNDSGRHVKQKRIKNARTGYCNKLLFRQNGENKINNQLETVSTRKLNTIVIHEANNVDDDCSNILKTFNEKSEKLPKAQVALSTNDNDIKHKKIKNQGKLLINYKNNNTRVTDEAINVIKTDLEQLKIQHINDMRLADDIRKLITTTATSVTSLEEKKLKIVSFTKEI